MEEWGEECEKCDEECEEEREEEYEGECTKPAFEMFECMDDDPVSVDACCVITSDIIYVIHSMIYVYFFLKNDDGAFKKKDRITNTQDNCAGFYFVKRGILLEGNMEYDPKHAIKIRKDK